MQIIPVFLSLVFAYGAICTQLPMNQLTQDFDNGHTLPLLSDLLMIQSHSTIFRDYLLSVRSIDFLLRDTTKAMTVLVPSNKAVLSMKRKPLVQHCPHTVVVIGIISLLQFKPPDINPPLKMTLRMEKLMSLMNTLSLNVQKMYDAGFLLTSYL